MILLILLLVILFLLTIILFDLFFVIKKFYLRIHIGQWSESNKWELAVLTQCKKWIYRTPTVKLTDNNEFILFDIMKGSHRSQTIQSWQDAGLVLGLLSVKENHLLDKFIAKKIDRFGQWRIPPTHIDSALLAYSILKYIQSDKSQVQKLRPAMDTIFNLISKHLDGNTIGYRKGANGVRFVDTLGLICPFLIKYGDIYNMPCAIKLAENQYKEYDVAFLTNVGFPCHSYDIVHKLPRGIYDWGRGVGWYILSLLEGQDASSTCDINIDFDKRIINLSESLLIFQNKFGGFGAMVFDLNSYPEASITCLAGLLFINAYALTNDQKYKLAYNRVEKCLMMITRRNGSIDYCQGDTKGIGYYSTTFSIMPFVQGLTLLFNNKKK